MNDKLTPLQINSSHSLQRQSDAEHISLYPSLDTNDNCDIIQIQQNCGNDNKCVPDLHLQSKMWVFSDQLWLHAVWFIHFLYQFPIIYSSDFEILFCPLKCAQFTYLYQFCIYRVILSLWYTPILINQILFALGFTMSTLSDQTRT